MTRATIIISVCMALYGVAAWMFELPPFKGSPTFYENVATSGQSYTCKGGQQPSMFIRFEEEGEVAVVSAAGRNLRLPYKGGDFMADTYESGPWRLTLDPEANLTGPRSVRFGACY
ncbi:hypothetical protein [Sphingomonas mucosissima]|uniref:Membrane-bound lysozyme-inhibitor of c-type lysozyme n=1 Tax=Sphingomonas mucosissima TaxID=370959 RepID=A0A245ZFP6_9SPHN|nr:hypothetical protein [Sphingomonas mucosissima]OWK28558.1 hypothetical protein SPMU_28190 [Sphingomonas mucosissima]